MPPISFNQVPTDSLVPFTYVEFDSSRAQQGPTIQPYTALVIGQRLTTGAQPSGTTVLATTEEEVGIAFGRGSMIHRMAQAWFQNNRNTRTEFLGMDDNGSGVDATGTITVTGTATAAGTVVFYNGGRRFTAAVDVGDSATDVAAAMVAANQANLDKGVLFSNVAGVITATARNAGEAGNNIDLRIRYYDDDPAVPAGITVAVTAAMSGGANNPSAATVIAAIQDKHYNVIVWPWLDSPGLAALETELDDRYGPIRQQGAVAFLGYRGTFAASTTFGDGLNSKHLSVMAADASPTPPTEWAAAVGAIAAREGSRDPARPFTTLEVVGVLPPITSKVFTQAERKLLLDDGISTFRVATDGSVSIGRLITTWQTNAGGAPDGTFRDVTTRLTLEYLRFDFRVQMLTTFPRHKLADDGNKIAAGQAIVTPSIGRGKAIAIFQGWQELGLVENLDQFKRDLVVERNGTDPNRLDFLLPPDLVNGYLITGAQIGFLL